MANLFNRILFGDKYKEHFKGDVLAIPERHLGGGGGSSGSSGMDVGVEVEVDQVPGIVEVDAPEVPVIPLKMIGGKPKPDDYIEYFQRWNIFIVIFLVSIILAILTIKDNSLVKAIFKEKKVNNIDMSTVGNGDEHQRWVKIIVFTLIFILLILVYTIGLLVLAYIYLGIGSVFMNENITVGAKFKQTFWKYKNFMGKEVFIGKSYIVFLLVVLFIVYVAYIGFSKWYPDWFDSMYFQSTDKKKEESQPQKYIYYYALLIIVMLFLYIIMLDIDLLSKNKMYMFYNLIFLIIYMMLSVYMLKEYAVGKKKRLLWMILVILMMFLFYPILLNLLKQDMGKNDIFNSKFLKNLLFNFGLPIRQKMSPAPSSE
jgi:hypothetical protein